MKRFCFLILITLLAFPLKAEGKTKLLPAKDHVFPGWKFCVDIGVAQSTKGELAQVILARYREEHPGAIVDFCSNGQFFGFRDRVSMTGIFGIGPLMKDGENITVCTTRYPRAIVTQSIELSASLARPTSADKVMCCFQCVPLIADSQLAPRDKSPNVHWSGKDSYIVLAVDQIGNIHLTYYDGKYMQSLSAIQYDQVHRKMKWAVALDGGGSVYPGHRRLIQSILVIVEKSSSAEYADLKRRLTWAQRLMSATSKPNAPTDGMIQDGLIPQDCYLGSTLWALPRYPMPEDSLYKLKLLP